MAFPPEGLQPLLDGDIIRYEVGYAAETGWRHITEDPSPENLPPFDFVRELLHQRIDTIAYNCRTTLPPKIYMTEGRTFRYDVAKKKPYKGTRSSKKPWHFDNLTTYLRDVLGAQIVTGIEADDQLAIDHVSSNGTTILCSRDKDLKQIPGWFYSWELGQQPSFGPLLITKEGSLEFTPAIPEKKRPAKLTGTGYKWFCAQCLIGDPTDNIPGLPGCGPVEAYKRLTEGIWEGDAFQASQLTRVLVDSYTEHYGPTWEQELTEQGRLTWLVRRLNEDRTPVLWEIGMTE